MPLALSSTAVVLGNSFPSAKSIDADSVALTKKVTPVAIAAQLTTRTSASIGIITLPAGHGITTGMFVDIYWGTASLRIEAGATVSVNALTLASGSGDDLPTNLTYVTVAVVREEPLSIPAAADADLQFIVAGGNVARSSVRFHASDDAALIYSANIGAGRSFLWDLELAALGFTNPLSTEGIGTVRFSHANTTVAESVKVAAGIS